MIDNMLGKTLGEVARLDSVMHMKLAEPGIYSCDLATGEGYVVEQHWLVVLSDDNEAGRLDIPVVADFRTLENARMGKYHYEGLIRLGFDDQQNEYYRRQRRRKNGRAYGISEQLGEPDAA